MCDRTDPLRQFVFDNNLHTDTVPTDRKRLLVEQACSELGKHPVSVYRAIAKVKTEGSLSRCVRSDKGRIWALSPQAMEHLREIVANRRHLSYAKIHADLGKAFPTEHFCYNTVRAAIKVIERELEAAKIKHLPERRTFEHANDEWQIDASRSDFFIADPKHNGGKPTRVPLIVVIDCFTRSILWACYSFYEDTPLVGQLLYNAVRPKKDPGWPMHGRPVALRCDNGKIFKSASAKDMVKSLGIRADYSRPHVPQDKPYVERVIGTIHRQFEDTLPGSCGPDNRGDNAVSAESFRLRGGRYYDRRPPGASKEPAPLLTLDEANSRLWRYIAEEYHQNTHSGIGCSPIVAWRNDIHNVPSRLDSWEPTLRLVCFTAAKTRNVRKGEVRINGLIYGHERLLNYSGLTLTVRYMPADCRSVLIYDKWNELICEAIAQGAKFIHDDTCSVRTQKKGRQDDRRRVKAQRDAIENAKPHEIPDLKQKIASREEQTLAVALEGQQTPLALLSEDQRAAVPEHLRDRQWPRSVVDELRGLKPDEIPEHIEYMQSAAHISVYGLRACPEYDFLRDGSEADDDGTDIIPLPSAASPHGQYEDLNDIDITGGANDGPAAHYRRADAEEAEVATPRAAGGDK